MWAHEIDEIGLPCLCSTRIKGILDELLWTAGVELNAEFFLGCYV